MVDEQQLLKDLVDAISVWLEGGRGRSLSSLARRCHVAYSTIRRIAQNESTPHPYTALAISEVIMTTKERIAFLQKHFPTIGNLMDECYVSDISEKSDDTLYTEFLTREPHNRIFNIAATSKGTTRQQIQRLTGQFGVEALDEMIASEVLVEDSNGNIRYVHSSWAIGKIENALDQVRLSTGHFDRKLVGTDGASLMHATASISKEAIPKLKKLVVDFIREVHKLKHEPSNQGDIPFFCDLVYSLYDREDWKDN